MELVLTVGATTPTDTPNVDGGHRRLIVTPSQDGINASCEVYSKSGEIVWQESVPVVGAQGSSFVLKLTPDHEPRWPFKELVAKLRAAGLSSSNIHPMQDDTKFVEILTHADVLADPAAELLMEKVLDGPVIPPGIPQKRCRAGGASWIILHRAGAVIAVYFRMDLNGTVEDLDTLLSQLKQLGRKAS